MPQPQVISFRDQLRKDTLNDEPHLTGIVGHHDLRAEDQLIVGEEIHWYLRAHAARYTSDWPGTHLIMGLAPEIDRIVSEKAAHLPTLTALQVRPVNQQRTVVAADPLQHAAPLEKPDKTVLGHWMAENCDVLLVLWDGNHNGKPGSTSDTVAHAMSEACTNARRAKGLSAITIHHLVVPTASNPFPMGEAYTWRSFEGPKTVRHGKLWFFRFLSDRWTQAQISFLLGITAVGVGWLGFVYHKPPQNGTEAFFNAVSFLALNNLTLNLTSHNANALLVAARFIAVAFVGFTSLVILAHLLIDRIIIWWASRNRGSGGHAIICGAGWLGRRVVEELVHKHNRRVVVVEEKNDEGFDVWCRTHGVGLVQGDACNADNLNAAGIGTASAMYVFCNNDDVTIRIVSTASSLCQHETQAIVSLESKRMFSVLQSAMDRPPMLDAEMLNVDAITVQMLLDRYPFDRFQRYPCPGKITHNPRVLIIGESSVAREILRQVLQMAHFEKDANGKPITVEISIAVPDPDGFAASFAKRYGAYIQEGKTLVPADSWAQEQCVLPMIRVLELPDSERALTDPGSEVEQFMRDGGGGASTVFVAIDEGHKSIEVARALANSRQIRVPSSKDDLAMLIYVNEKDNAYRQRVSHNLNAHVPMLPIVVFGDFVGEASPVNLEQIPTERLARHINAWYTNPNKIDDESFATHEWSRLPEDHKDSSRQAAAHVAVKIRIQARLSRQGRGGEAQDQLAQAEHRRWCAEKLLKGYVPWEKLNGVHACSHQHELLYAEWKADKRKIQAAYRHFDLAPFDQLLPAERTKDLAQIHYATGEYMGSLKTAWHRRFFPT